MTSEKKAPVLSEQEFRQVVAAVRAHDSVYRNVALLYFSVALGLRAKEMSQLKLQDVMRFDHTSRTKFYSPAGQRTCAGSGGQRWLGDPGFGD